MPAGPMGPESSATGADVDGLRERTVGVVAMMEDDAENEGD